ncbi:hypothetical protein U9M48_030937, partial [Paspalum notatum var. saurae]
SLPIEPPPYTAASSLLYPATLARSPTLRRRLPLHRATRHLPPRASGAGARCRCPHTTPEPRRRPRPKDLTRGALAAVSCCDLYRRLLLPLLRRLQRAAPSRVRVAAVGISSRASSFVGGGGLAAAAASIATRPRRAGSAGGGGALGCQCLFGLGVPELAVIAGIAALVFGPKRLPEIGRNIGKTVKSFEQD